MGGHSLARRDLHGQRQVSRYRPFSTFISGSRQTFRSLQELLVAFCPSASRRVFTQDFHSDEVRRSHVARHDFQFDQSSRLQVFR